MRWRLAACGVVVAAGALRVRRRLRRTRRQRRPTITRLRRRCRTSRCRGRRTAPTTPARGRYRDRPAPAVPPAWTFYGHHLLELPPVAGYGLLYEESFDGRIHAIDPKTGAVKWSYYSRRCGWSSPALADGLVFATFIGGVSERCSQLPDGAIVALSAQTGKIRWSRNIGQSESSPLVSHGIVYFGSTDGYVYAFSAATGKQRWSFDTGGPVKGSPALAHGRLFIGNYGGTFYALDARTGEQIWQSGGHGNFYAGPSVVDGRVYVGSIDGRVYAFSARNGEQLWSFGTGGYVYASTAVWRGIVLVGSYDHRFYAINGATGSERWSFDAGGHDLRRRVGDRRPRLLLHAQPAQDVRPRSRERSPEREVERRRLLPRDRRLRSCFPHRPRAHLRARASLTTESHRVNEVASAAGAAGSRSRWSLCSSSLRSPRSRSTSRRTARRGPTPRSTAARSSEPTGAARIPHVGARGSPVVLLGGAAEPSWVWHDVGPRPRGRDAASTRSICRRSATASVAARTRCRTGSSS